MNCPTCNQPMRTRNRADIDPIGGVYEYEEMFCAEHPEAGYQTPEQLQENLDAIKAARERAQTKKK